MGVLEDVREQYPTLAFLLNDPEVGPLLRDAVDPNKGFSPQTFQAKLYQTKWFKSRSTTARQMDILKNTDPAEWKRLVNTTTMKMRMLNSQMGLGLTRQEMNYMAQGYTRYGIDPGSEEFMISLRKHVGQASSKRIGSGTVTAAELAVRDMAKSGYYVPMTDQEARTWGLDLAFGTKDENALKAALSARAQSMYPHLRELLKNGASMEEIFSGHRATIAEELELSPEQIDFTKDWKKVLHQIDPATGKPRPMTLHETQTLARQDKRWWQTAKGRQSDAGMANFILKTFGKRA